MQGIIIGGGIVGLTTALAMHRAGIAVRVYEQAADIRELGVGLNLLPHSVKHLVELGLQEALDTNGVRTGELRFFCKNGKAIWQEPRGLAAGYDVPQYSIHRGRLQRILRDAVIARLGEKSLITDRSLTGFVQQEQHVVATLVDREGNTFVEHGDFLVGADGINSAVRGQLYPDEGAPNFAGLMLWRGATRAPGFMTGRTMFMAGHSDQKVVVYPLSEPDENGEQLINWVAEFRVPLDTIHRDDWNNRGSLDEFVDRFSGWTFGTLDAVELFRGAPEIFKFPMCDRDPLPRWTHGQVTLAGDAAHAMFPNGSNGASQGILDAVALARNLAGVSGGTLSLVDALLAYEEERIGPTSQLLLDNRKTGPERVLQYVEERCDGQCESEHQCVPKAELEEVANAYKKLAGFDRKAVNQPGSNT